MHGVCLARCRCFCHAVGAHSLQSYEGAHHPTITWPRLSLLQRYGSRVLPRLQDAMDISPIVLTAYWDLLAIAQQADAIVAGGGTFLCRCRALWLTPGGAVVHGSLHGAT